jgi:2-aminoadipate transaminase
LWGILPESLESAEVLKVAIEEKVAFVPGGPFFPCGGGHNTMRINFSNATPENIRTGIGRLGNVLYQMVREHAVGGRIDSREAFLLLPDL